MSRSRDSYSLLSPNGAEHDAGNDEGMSYLTKSKWTAWIPSIRPRTLFLLIRILVPAAGLFFLAVFILYEPYLALSWYPRWWLKQNLEPVPPLAGCFEPSHVSPLYNLSDALHGARHTEVHAGARMPLSTDCYAFAATIPNPPPSARAGVPLPREQRTHFHTYWRTDLAPFSERQEWMLKSFFATQDTDACVLVLWSNGDLSSNDVIQRWIRRYPDALVVKVVDYEELARGTPLEGSERLQLHDKRAWVDGDLLRLLVLWGYGGVWVDMDELLTRDLAPLLEHEFVGQWDCFEREMHLLNGAVMRFHQHSPYLCEAFHIIASSPAPRARSTDWGALLYLALWRRLVHAGLPPFKVLPWCFTDGRMCGGDLQLPDPFQPDPAGGDGGVGMGMERGGGLDRVVSSVFSVHLHNQYRKAFPEEGWVRRLLLDRYEERLGEQGQWRGQQGAGAEAFV